jgi:hypothetical protein
MLKLKGQIQFLLIPRFPCDPTIFTVMLVEISMWFQFQKFKV